LRVLLAPLGSHGDVHPFLGLGLALKSRGHDVHVITSGSFRALVERYGFEFAPVGTAADFEAMIHDPDMWHPRRSIHTLFGNPDRLARHARDGYRHIVERTVPGDTVVAAGMLAFWARLAHDKTGVPLATVHLQPSVMVSHADPPEFATIRMRAWWPRPLKSLLYWIGDRLMVDPMLGPVVNDFRRELGLPPVRHILGRWMHSPQIILGTFPEWYAHTPDWPAQFRHAGFVRFDQADAALLSPELETFLKGAEPPIVFTFGSAMRQGKPYFAAAVEACRLLGRRGLLLAKGRDQIPESLPPTMLHAEYAPFSDVFPRAAAVVHHGGIGTCAQGLAAGVPQLVMPLAFDQPDNARRLERLGVGARVWPKRFTGKNVANALRKLLGTPTVTVRCQEVAGWMMRGDPAVTACDMIEGLGRVVPL
jgi:rhamnosyltransferase subunit B